MRPHSQLRIVVTGLIAQHPHLGGVAWDYLQYPLGLRQMGHDVYYLEDSGEWPYTLDGGPSGDDWVAKDCTSNVAHLKSVMDRFGMEGRWMYRCPLDATWHGLSDSARKDVLASADLLINISGTLEHPEHYDQVGRRIYVDSDPGFTQAKIAGNDSAFGGRVAQHDLHFSFGECHSENVPSTHYDWMPTRQPIVLDQWTTGGKHRDVYTTVMSWTSYKPLVYRNLLFGQKDLEFRKFLELPRHAAPSTFEIALGSTEHVNWSRPEEGPEPKEAQAAKSARETLRDMGWSTVDSYTRCGDLDSYREYIQTSKGEWSVAKNGYVVAQAGWFSCRSACYLAAGRPVVVQDTGFTSVIPTGRGLLSFTTLEQAVESIAQVEHDYQRHALAAREVAREYFRAEDVLGRLIEDSMARTCVTAIEEK